MITTYGTGRIFHSPGVGFITPLVTVGLKALEIYLAELERRKQAIRDRHERARTLEEQTRLAAEEAKLSKLQADAQASGAPPSGGLEALFGGGSSGMGAMLLPLMFMMMMRR
jgi:hypothetical protein